MTFMRIVHGHHIGHHAVDGKGNYNIVFPGPDHLAGTFYQLKT